MCLCKRSETWENSGWISLSLASCSLLNVTQSLVKNVSICPCHLCSVFPAVPLPPVWIIFSFGFHMGPWGIHALIALKFPFSGILCFEDTHAGYHVCPWAQLLASHTLHSLTRLISCTVHDLISLLGLCVSLGFHWSWSHVSSSFVKTCRVSKHLQDAIPLEEAWLNTSCFLGG